MNNHNEDDFAETDIIKGNFSFGNTILSVLVCLTALFLPAILVVAVDDKETGYAIAILVFMIAMTLTIGFCYIPGSYRADDKSVTFRILFRTYKFEYSDIQSVKIENSDGGHSRFTNDFAIKTELTLQVKGRSHSFRSVSSCCFSVNEQLNDPDSFKKRIDELEFVQLGKFIKAHIKTNS